ncbi:ABC transporter substrate-binding protein [Streptomyces sp. C10-9-1]|uniref:ABC transporter substrate-binding protein n=1 Tax=Streptomyces sp. C10-9-1 TaxID=1859285 RepID=UPI003D70AFBF
MRLPALARTPWHRTPVPRSPARRAPAFRSPALRASAVAAALAALLLPALPSPAAAAHPTALAPAAAPGRTAEGDGERRVLTVAVSQSVDSLSPFLAQRLVSTSIHRLAYEYLTNYDPADGRTVPGFATAWKASADKLTWTFTIRSDSTWSDGRPATAEDAAWTFTTMMRDPDAATANGSFTANFRRVTAPDPTTLVIELKKPQATMTALDVPIVPRHVWEKVDDFAAFGNDAAFPVVGNGPFVITGFEVDRYIRLEANKDFWRGAPGFDELVFRYYKDGDAAVSALRKGEVSFVQGLTPAQADSLEEAGDIAVNDAPGRRFLALAVNPGARAQDGTSFGNGHPALLDPGVRRALFHAVDRTALVARVFQGHAVEGEGYIPPRFSRYFWEPGPGRRIGHDPQRAARLLDEAGYRKGGDGRRAGPDGRPLELRLLCHATDPNDKAVGRYLQEWWGALGITLTVECLDNVSDPWLKGDYDLAFDGWSVNPDPDFVLAIHTCAALPETPGASGATDNFICDRTYDELYERQAAEYDPEKRAELVRRMQSRLYDTGYMNILAYPNAMEAYRTDHIASLTTMPEAAGNIYGQDGYWSWWSAEPAAPREASGGGAATGFALGAGAAVLLAVAAGSVVVMRRRSTADDRE